MIGGKADLETRRKLVPDNHGFRFDFHSRVGIAREQPNCTQNNATRNLSTGSGFLHSPILSVQTRRPAVAEAD